MEKERFEILLEDIRSQVKLIAEGHSVLDYKIDGTNKRLDETNQKLDFVAETLSGRLDETNSRIDKTNHKLDFVAETLSGRLDETNKQLMELRKDMRQFNKRILEILDKHENQFQNHESRIITLEKV